MSEDAELAPPESFDDFRLIRRIGRGAMGEVWMGHDRHLDRPVAVKFIRGLAGDAQRARFLVEARAIARLSHPNVVTIYRAGEVLRRPYLVSELVVGRNLADLPRPLPAEELLPIALGLARGLAAAHRRGVLHRDIKPANAIVAEDGEVKLLDFGVARLLDDAVHDTAGAPPVPRTATDPDATRDGPGRAAAAAPAGGDTAVSRSDGLIGTPRYLAPELWHGEPASRASDIWSLGLLLYELASGRTPDEDASVAELASRRRSRPVPPLAEAVPGFEARFAAVIDRCVEREPERRFATGDTLRDALEALREEAAPAGSVPDGNPYRGLQRFEAAHRRLFFGRDADIRALTERLRTEPMVVVAGDSGVGKSSLCRAGVLPAFEAAGWTVARLTPGRQPLAALAAACAPLLGGEEPALVAAMTADAGELARALRRRAAAGHRAVVFIDQLEELCTLASAEDAAVTAEVLAGLALPATGVRLLVTVRGDFLGRLAALPRLGAEVTGALHLVRALGAEGLREAVVGPARVRGVRFESEALVDELIAGAVQATAGLPLLSFALAELWDARDQARGVITAAALAAIGGVGGALARHADAVVAALVPAEREAVRRIFGRLVTPAGTRTRRRAAELAPDDDAAARAGLEALVRARLVVPAGESDDGGTWQIAHEALLEGWDTLREWLSRGAERRAATQRVERAADEWRRLGRRPDGLWTARQLAEATLLDDAELGRGERDFLRASRRAARRRRWLRGGAIAAVPLIAALAYGAVELSERRDRERRIAGYLTTARGKLAEARAGNARVEELRRATFAHYDAGEPAEGEAGWAQILARAPEVEQVYSAASRAIDGALEVAPRRGELLALQCDVLYERALIAERDHRAERVVDLVDRLTTCDVGGARRHRWSAPAEVSIEVTPPGATVAIEHHVPDGNHVIARPHTAAAAAPLTARLAPGSYVFAFAAPGHAPARLPILLRRGERLTERIALPPLAAVPDGMLHVPAGRFQYGSDDSTEELRHWNNAMPMHEVASDAYLIGRHEVTFGEWIAYLETLAPTERAAAMPRIGALTAESVGSRFGLEEAPGGRWRFFFRRADHTYTALDGEMIEHQQRTRRARQDWRRFPVSGVSHNDARAYTAWLDATGKVPRARLCTDHEWERAARGADGRLVPNGDRLDPDDANVDETYGRLPLAFGPDEVGSHPLSRSPVGADDLAGNVWEWVISVHAPGQTVMRGGAWYKNQLAARATNREHGEPDQRDPLIGFRICATP